MTICPKCQTQNAPGTTFCVGCGQALPGRSARRATASGEGGSKGMAMTAMILGILSVPTFGCALVGAITAIVLGAIAYGRANKEPDVYGGKGMAMAGMILGGVSFLMIPVIGMVSAIAIPSLLRARVSTNESAAIGDLRTIVSAEAAYQSANGGYYDTLECLGAPARCIPGYTGPVMLQGPLATDNGLKTGYRHTLHPGAPAPRGSSISPSSLTAYAVVAVPISQGQTGVRAFCSDSTGVMRYWPLGAIPEITDGQCPSDGIVMR